MSIAPLVIVNPTAGGGRARKAVPWIAARLAGIPGGRLIVTTRRGEAEAIGAAALRRAEHDRIVVAGGDGTIQDVVNGFATGSGFVALGILPVGSGNDLARSLGLPGTLDAAWQVAIGDRLRGVDIVRATNGDGASRWFSSAAGVGFDAQVAAAMADRRPWQRGRIGYLATVLTELRRLPRRHVELEVDADARAADILLVAIANGAYYGGGMRIAPGARPDDGLLDVCVVSGVSRRAAIAQLPNLYRGTHVTHPAVRMLRGRRAVVRGDAGTPIHLDGEPFGTLPLTAEVEPGRLEVAVPA